MKGSIGSWAGEDGIMVLSVFGPTPPSTPRARCVLTGQALVAALGIMLLCSETAEARGLDPHGLQHQQLELINGRWLGYVDDSPEAFKDPTAPGVVPFVDPATTVSTGNGEAGRKPVTSPQPSLPSLGASQPTPPSPSPPPPPRSPPPPHLPAHEYAIEFPDEGEWASEIGWYLTCDGLAGELGPAKPPFNPFRVLLGAFEPSPHPLTATHITRHSSRQHASPRTTHTALPTPPHPPPT